MTPTPYEVFMLHISHDGKPSSPDDLQRQEKEIERKLRNYERKAQKNPGTSKPQPTFSKRSIRQMQLRRWRESSTVRRNNVQHFCFERARVRSN
jgi:hypothetical protein